MIGQPVMIKTASYAYQCTKEWVRHKINEWNEYIWNGIGNDCNNCDSAKEAIKNERKTKKKKTKKSVTSVRSSQLNYDRYRFCMSTFR